jgi:Outer membrane protein beta-barrel family/Carboxypeptidase regulatory-like domain
MRKLASIIIALFFFNIATFAQSANINGKIVDKVDNKTVAGAIISLLKQKDSSAVSETVSSDEGDFLFTNITPDSLILKINTLNYQEYISLITLKNENKTLATINLEPQGKNLATVTVVSRTPPVVQKGDTSQFSASQYKVNPDATTEDLIKKMPGISVAKDGTVTAQGETVKKVTIDGKDFFGDDASAALKNINAEAVDKIQVFDRLSDQARLTGFDDGNSTKAINIVTKASVKNGQFGRLYAGAGTDDRYNAGGNASFFKGLRKLSFVGSFNNINQQNFASQDLLGLTSGNSGGNRGGPGGGGPQGGGRGGPGGGMGGGNDFSVGQSNGISKTNAIGINFSNEYNKKLTVAGSYFYNQSRNNNQSVVNTENFLQQKDTSLFTKQNSNSSTNNTNHRINLRLEYNFDSSNSLFFIPNINFQKNDAVSITDINNYFGQPANGKLYDTANNSATKNVSNRNGYNIRNSLLFRHAFAKKGRSISFGLNHSITKNNSESTADADFIFFNNNMVIKDSLQQLYDNISTGKTVGGTIAYTEPLSKKSQLQFDYNPSVQKSKADQQTFDFDGQKYTKFDTLLSNKFDNTITTNNGGVTYRFVPNKDQQFQVGVSYQTTKLESNRTFPSKTNVNQSFSNFLPNLMFRKKLAKYSNIRIFYRASTNFPSVTQLQDVVNLTNPLRVSAGNPLLKQSYTQFLGSRFTYTNTKTTNSFFVGFFVQTANDYITNATFIPSLADSSIQNGIELKKGAQFTKPLNLNGYRSARSFFTYSMPLKFIKTTLNLNAGFTYQRLPGQINTTAILTNNTVYNTGFSLASNISEYIDYNISYAANFSQTNSSITGSNNFVNQAAGLQINLLSKKGWFVQNDVSYQTNTGLSAGFNQKFGIWNAAVGRKFLKKNAGELKLSVFDLLKQNQSVNRTIDARYIEDAQSVVLQQYFMLTFTYSLKNFGKAKPSTRADNKEEINRMMQPR